MVQTSKGNAKVAESSTDVDVESEDKGGIKIAVLDVKENTSSTWEKAKVMFREKLEAEEGGKLKKRSLEFLNEIVTPQQALAQCEKTKDRAEKEYTSKKEITVAGRKFNLKEKMVRVLKKM